MQILITGAGGQLGRELQRALAGHDVTALARAQLDVCDAEAVRAAVERARPEAVVHCAALTDTTRCEREPELAVAVNAGGAENVARACAAAGARLLAISTNEVFDGETGAPYAEDDEPSAVNAYGRSKLEGERRARAAHADTLVVRAAWLYGEGEANFIEKVRAAARAGRTLRFVTDEVATPTADADLATALRALLERQAPAGVYHLTNEGEASRYDWAAEILRLSRIDAPIERVTTAELRAGGYAGPRKPRYSVLANTRAAALGVTLRPWQEALAAFVARERARVPADE
jgi:dTDP-4-dehydrorhamnose reductase